MFHDPIEIFSLIHIELCHSISGQGYIIDLQICISCLPSNICVSSHQFYLIHIVPELCMTEIFIFSESDVCHDT